MDLKKRNPILTNYKYSKDVKEFREKSRKEKINQGRGARADMVRRKRSMAPTDPDLDLSAEDSSCKSEPLKERNVNVSRKPARGNFEIKDKKKLEMLEWKAKRDRERQMEAKKYKEGQFVVKHVKYAPANYLVSAGSNDTKPKEKGANQTANHRPVTRSQAKRIASNTSTKKTKATEEPRTKKKVTNSNHGVTRAQGAKTRSKQISTSVEPPTQVKRKGSVGRVFNFAGKGSENPQFENPSKVTDNEPTNEENTLLKLIASKSLSGIIPEDMSIENSRESFTPQTHGLVKAISDESEKVHSALVSTISKTSSTTHENEISISTSENLEEKNSTLPNLQRLETKAGRVTEGSNSSIPNTSPSSPKVLSANPSKEILTPESEHSEERSPSQDLEQCTEKVAVNVDPKINVSPEKIATPLDVVRGRPGKTPKRHLPRHLIEAKSMDFSPRRIMSTAHFTKKVGDERQKLITLNDTWNSILANTELTEEVNGTIRTVIGQAELLMDQRFKQFEGLIKVHQAKNADKDATASDLQGFWDMVYFQVEDVHKKFSDLEELKKNDWKVEQKVKRTAAKKKITEKKPKRDLKDGARERQSAMRKFKQEMKAKMQAAKHDDVTDVQIKTGHQPAEGCKNQSNVADDIKAFPALQTNTYSSDSDQSKPRSNSSGTEMSSDSLDDTTKTKVKTTKPCTPARRKSVRLNPEISDSFCDGFGAISLNTPSKNFIAEKSKIQDWKSRGVENELAGEEIEKNTPFKARYPPSAQKSAIPVSMSKSRRRSTRKTPSKYRTSSEENRCTNVEPQKVACNLFMDGDVKNSRSHKEEPAEVTAANENERQTPMKTRNVPCKTPSAEKSGIPLDQSESRRRSMRKTPSKYRTPFAEKHFNEITPEDVACNLFTDSDVKCCSPAKEEPDLDFARYLRPSVTDESDTEKNVGDDFKDEELKELNDSEIIVPSSCLLDSSIHEQQMQTPLI